VNWYSNCSCLVEAVTAMAAGSPRSHQAVLFTLWLLPLAAHSLNSARGDSLIDAVRSVSARINGCAGKLRNAMSDLLLQAAKLMSDSPQSCYVLCLFLVAAVRQDVSWCQQTYLSILAPSRYQSDPPTQNPPNPCISISIIMLPINRVLVT
jgi:hypothetical protein